MEQADREDDQLVLGRLLRHLLCGRAGRVQLWLRASLPDRRRRQVSVYQRRRRRSRLPDRDHDSGRRDARPICGVRTRFEPDFQRAGVRRGAPGECGLRIQAAIDRRGQSQPNGRLQPRRQASRALHAWPVPAAGAGHECGRNPLRSQFDRPARGLWKLGRGGNPGASGGQGRASFRCAEADPPRQCRQHRPADRQWAENATGGRRGSAHEQLLDRLACVQPRLHRHSGSRCPRLHRRWGVVRQLGFPGLVSAGGDHSSARRSRLLLPFGNRLPPRLCLYGDL